MNLSDLSALTRLASTPRRQLPFNSFRRVVGLILALSPSVLSSAWAEEEIIVGRNAAGLLRVHIEFDQPLVLETSIFPGITGYATGEMGMHSNIFDDPTNDFFQLSTAADFRFILLAKDPGMEVWNDTGSAYMGIGESYYIGQSPFDNHPIWNIVTGTPGNSYSLTLKLRDLNGVYPDSTPFALNFTPEFPPGPFHLNLSQTDSLHATLSWPTNAFGWKLESAASVLAGNWQAVTNPPSIAGTNFALTVTTAADQQFFRLHKP